MPLPLLLICQVSSGSAQALWGGVGEEECERCCQYDPQYRPSYDHGSFSLPQMVGFSTESKNRKERKKKKKKSPLISYAPSACQCINGILTTALYTANLLQLEELSAKKKFKKLEPKQESEIRDKHISVYNSLPA